MPDFTLTPADEEILRGVREERSIGHGYARFFDRNEHRLLPPLFPEVANRPAPKELIEQRKDEISGIALLNVLVALEEHTNDVALRRRDNGLGQIIVRYAGTAEQIERWGNGFVVFALTEPGAGSDAAAIDTRARFDDERGMWILNGEKMYCTDFGGCEAVMVITRAPAGQPGLAAFIVDKGTPGLRSTGPVRKMGIRSWDTENFVLEDCAVPPINRIDVDFRKVMLVFNSTRPNAAAFGLGVAKALLDFTGEKLGLQGAALLQEAACGVPSAAAKTLLTLEAEYDAALLTVLQCKWLEDESGSAGNKVEAAMSKAIAGAAVRLVTQTCMELLGPLALSEEFLAEKWFRDGRIFDIFEGPGDINRLIVARWLLDYSSAELS